MALKKIITFLILIISCNQIFAMEKDDANIVLQSSIRDTWSNLPEELKQQILEIEIFRIVKDRKCFKDLKNGFDNFKLVNKQFALTLKDKLNFKFILKLAEYINSKTERQISLFHLYKAILSKQQLNDFKNYLLSINYPNAQKFGKQAYIANRTQEFNHYVDNLILSNYNLDIPLFSNWADYSCSISKYVLTHSIEPIEALQKIIQSGVTIDTQIDALIYAVETSQLKIIKLLINAGINVNQPDAKGRCPLLFAYDSATYELLLKAGASPNVWPYKKYRISLLADVLIENRWDLSEVLLKYGANPRLIPKSILAYQTKKVICNNQRNIVEKLLDADVDLRSLKDNAGYSIYDYAFKSKNELIRNLVVPRYITTSDFSKKLEFKKREKILISSFVLMLILLTIECFN